MPTRPTTARHPRRHTRAPLRRLCLAPLLALAVIAHPLLAGDVSAEPGTTTQDQAPAQSTPTIDDPDPDADGPEVRVYLRTGKQLSGTLVEITDTHISIKIEGTSIPIRYPLAEVEHREILPPFRERYRVYRDTVDPEDPDQILALAQWLEDHGKLTLAFAQVERALALNPRHPEALRLRDFLHARIKLRLMSARDRDDDADEDSDDTQRDDPKPEPRVFPVLDEQQINLIRVYEIDLDARPRVIIDRDTIRRLIEQHAASPLVPNSREGREALLRAPDHEVLDLMFRLQARDFYDQVRVLSDPPALRAFRDDINRGWLVNRCAHHGCHGGLDAAAAPVFADTRPTSDPSVYTNFLIIERSRLSTGEQLINYADPERSPLLQIALPRDISLHPHPEVPRGASGRDAFRPAFDSPDDRKFRAAVEWVNALYRPRPDYPIDYDLPQPARSSSQDPEQPPGSLESPETPPSPVVR